MAKPVRENFIPFCVPSIDEEEVNEVCQCLRSGWLTTGPRTKTLEAMFEERLSVSNAVAVNSATAGWNIVAHALGIEPGDEVIVPSITWVSSANVVELLGAKVVFADVLPDTLQIDPNDVARKISPRTRAVFPVHFAGAPCDMTALRELTNDTEITLVEDAAHALGTFHGNNEIGSRSEVAIFSFHPIKNITTGEGGMVVLNDDKLADRLRRLRFHGITKNAWSRYGKTGRAEYEVIEPGYKYNMMDIQAALGICQLPKLDAFNKARRHLAERYTDSLRSLPEVKPLSMVPYKHRHAWHLFVVQLEVGALRISRSEFLDELMKANIGAGLHFLALHTQPYYRSKYGTSAEDCPCASAASDSILSLPLYPSLSEKDQDSVVEELHRIVENNRV